MTTATWTPHILCVDDEPSILDALKRLFRRSDYQVTTANSGLQALQQITNGKNFDLIISDMRMPEMDGASLLAEVRKRTPETIRVILSGYSEKESIMKTVGPSHQFLAKPCDEETLTKMINRCLSLKKHLKKQ